MGRTPPQQAEILKIRAWLQQLDPTVMDHLTVRQAELIRLRFLGDSDSFPSYAQMAHKAGIRANSVRSTIERALLSLQQAEVRSQARYKHIPTGWPTRQPDGHR